MKQLAMEEANDGTTGSTGGAVNTAQDDQADAPRTTEDQTPDGPATGGATSTAPEVVESAAAPAASDPVPTGPRFTEGMVVLVSKGADRIPVELRNQVHLDELLSIHGAGNVEVQS